jgi:hypothetical protein
MRKVSAEKANCTSTAAVVSVLVTLSFSVLPVATQASDDFRVNDTIAGDQHYGDVAMDANGGLLFVYTSPGDGVSNFGTQILGKRYDAAANATSGEIVLSQQAEYEDQRSGQVCHRADGGWVLAYYNRSYDPNPGAPLLEREGVFARFLAEDGTPSSAAFRISSPIASTQGGTEIGVACLPDGGFFAAWGSSDQDGSYYGVFGRRVDAAGAVVGDEIQVNTETEGSQGNFGGVKVAAGPGGTVLVMWSSNCAVNSQGTISCPVEPDGSASSAQARLFNPAGIPVGDEFRLNTTTAGTQGTYGLAAAFDDDDNFLAVYYSGDLSSAQCGGWLPCGTLLAQRFDSSGNRLGLEFEVSAHAAGLQLHPDVAPNGSGGYFVVWEDAGTGGPVPPNQIKGRHFDGLGVPLSADFRVTSNEAIDDRDPMITGRDGSYVVGWVVFDNFWGEGRDVAARTLSSVVPTCPASPSESCSTEDSSKLSVKQDSGGGGTLLWKWASNAETPAVDPAGGMLGVALCIYDQYDGLVMSTVAKPLATCGARSCWRGRRGAAKYRAARGTAFAIRSFKMKTKPTRTRVRLKAAGEEMPMAALGTVSAPLVAQLVSQQGGCWQVQYDSVTSASNKLRATAN